jgi:large subunit ribosomal protein L32
MSVRMRHTRSHTKNRRSHHGLKGVRMSTCGKCGEAHVRHKICLNCGTYKGREYVDVLKKLTKKEKKEKEKELAAQEGAKTDKLDAEKLSQK